MVNLDGYLIDADLYPELSQRRWKPNKDGYAIGKTRVGMENRKRKALFMHRIIAKAKEGEIVDHINGDITDNRRENLRIVDAYQNSANRKATINGSSQYKGVFFTSKKVKGKTYNYWCAKLKKHGEVMYCKHFKDEIDAAKAYDEQALIHHGEYARLNFPKTV